MKREVLKIICEIIGTILILTNAVMCVLSKWFADYDAFLYLILLELTIIATFYIALIFFSRGERE